MDRGRPRLRGDLRLPIAGGRDLYDLHLPRRQRLGLRQGRPDLLHPLLRQPRLHPVLLDVAADLAVCAGPPPHFPAALFPPPVRQPPARRTGRARGRRGADPLYGSPAQGPRHHRLDQFLRVDLAQRGDLDRRGDRHGLRDGVGRARLGMERGRQGRVHPAGRSLPRHLPAASPLWRIRRHVQRDRRGQARFPGAAGARPERVVVHLERAALGAGLLHVAALVRRALYRPGRERVPQERDRPAALPADPALRVLCRIRGGLEGSGPEGRRSGPGAVQDLDPELSTRGSSASSAAPAF